MFESLENRQMFSATATVDPAATQTTDTTPQPTVTADSITRKVDKASPTFFQMACSGTPFK